MAKKFWLGERTNPQIRKPYYKKYGQITQKEAKKFGKPVYGEMYMTSYDSEAEYNEKIEELKSAGFKVN